MKQLLHLFILFIGLTLTAQVETEVTNSLNNGCVDFTNCDDFRLGSCPGDLYSDGTPVPENLSQFQVYYVTENIDLRFNSLTLRNCRLEFRNGASLINNGITVDEQQDCDGATITEMVFLGGGGNFLNEEEMNQTLGITKLKLDRYNLPLGEKYQIADTSGRIIFKGITTENTGEDLKHYKGLNFLSIEGYKTYKLTN